MNSYDLDIDNYTLEELLPFLKINDSIDILTANILQNKTAAFKKYILNEPLKKNEKDNLLFFIEQAKQKLLSYVEKRAPVQLPPTNYNILQSQNQLSGAQHSVTTEKIVPVINAFDYRYPAGVLNPLEKRYFQKIISIDSLFRKNYYRSSSNSFTWELPRIENKVVGLKVASLNLSSLWYFISDSYGNNVFRIKLYQLKKYENSSYLITIPSGNYTAEEFVSLVNSIFINTGGGLEYLLIEVNKQNGKIIFRLRRPIDDYGSFAMSEEDDSYSEDFYYEIEFDITGSKECNQKEPDLSLQQCLGWYLGFKCPFYTINKTNYFQDDSIVPSEKFYFYLTGDVSYSSTKDNYIYLSIDDYCKNSLTETFSSTIGNVFLGNNILARINIQNLCFQSCPRLNFLYMNREYLGPVNLQKLSLKLINKFGKPVDINNEDFSISLELNVLY